MVKIQLLDMNDNAPIFVTKDYNVSLREGLPQTDSIVAIVATDADSGQFGVISYSIVNGNENHTFGIDKNTGDIFVANRGLFRGKYELEVAAVDGGGLMANQLALVHINVLPAGEGTPVFDKPRYSFRVRENLATGTKVGDLTIGANSRGKIFLISSFYFTK